ncbi:MAG TPA: hypothetical protein VJ227_01160 [Patescibacteria group bacterium]|nr:hypothetical protein [Patescibacteria group bacterium]
MADFGDLEINAEIRKIHEGNPVRPKLKFFYVEHGPGDAETIWEKVKDCDVILIEAFGDTEESRLEEEKVIASATRPGNDMERSRVLAFLTKAGEETDILSAITANCIKYGKELHFVDAYRGSEADNLLEQAKKNLDDSVARLRLGEMDLALDKYKEYLKFDARADALRERTVVRQVMQLEEARQYDWQGKTIGIIQGAAHTPTYHEYKKVGPNPNTEKIMPKPIYLYGPAGEIARRYRRHPNTHIPTIEIKRAFIEDLLIIPEIITREGSVSDFLSESNKITRKMSRRDVENYWQILRGTGSSRQQGESDPLTRIRLIDRDLRGISKHIVEKYS